MEFKSGNCEEIDMSVDYSLIKEKLHGNMQWRRFIYGVAAFFCCYLTLQPLSGQISRSVRFLYYFLCIFSFIKMDFVKKSVRNIFDKLWKKSLMIALEIYGTYAMVGMYFLYGGITQETSYPGLLYFALAFFWIHPIMQGFIALLAKMGDAVSVEEHKVRLWVRFILIGIVLLPCLLFLAAFNPAITTSDSWYCFEMAHYLWKPDVVISDWQPPFYLFALNLLLRICDSVSFLVIVQCIYFAVIFVDGILFLYQSGFSKKILGFFYLFIVFGISNIIQLVTLWKDIPYMTSLMWLTILLMKFTMQHDRYKDKKWWYLQLIIATILTAFFRQNGILPALAVIILLPFIMKFTPKTVCTGIVCLLLVAAVKGPLYNSMDVVSQPQLKFFSLANDIMYSYYMGEDVSDDALTMINKITGNAPDNFGYSPYWVYYNSNEPSGYSIVEFIKIYGENIIRNPKMAVMAVLTRNSVLWSIMKPSGEIAGCVNLLTDYHGQSVGLQPSDLYPYRVDNILTHILEKLCNWFTDRQILYLFYWRTGIYNLLIIFMVGITFCSWQKRKWMYLIPYVPILGNLAALFISSGWTDYRYFWPSMAISLFLLFYFLFSRKMQLEEND